METTSISRKPAVKPGWGRWQSWQSEEADSRETLRMRGVRRGSHRIQKKKKKKDQETIKHCSPILCISKI